MVDQLQAIFASTRRIPASRGILQARTGRSAGLLARPVVLCHLQQEGITLEEVRADVAIIGGGVMGPSVAYHLRTLNLAQDVVVFEQDPLHMHSSTGLSAGGIRQLFSTAANIALARWSVDFYRRFPEVMATAQGPGPDVGFRQNGYLFLLDKANESALLRRADYQQAHGVELERLTPAQVKERYPELATDDLTGGIFGVEAGFLDPYQVMRGFTDKARELGVRFVPEEAVAIEMSQGRVRAVSSANVRVKADVVVNAAGAWAGKVGRLAGVDVPVVPKARQIYICDVPEDRFANYPLTVDPSGFYFRPEAGGRVLCGKAFDDDPEDFVWDWNRGLFQDAIWPDLATRVPMLERLHLGNGWCGLYEVTPDDNAIIGPHPDLGGFQIIAGFSGHGMMQGPAAGLALAEIIAYGAPRSVAVDGLDLARFAEGRLIQEDAVV
jgi:glycine/D-amino acid oxidase-like deaminating enzyme